MFNSTSATVLSFIKMIDALPTEKWQQYVDTGNILSRDNKGFKLLLKLQDQTKSKLTPDALASALLKACSNIGTEIDLELFKKIELFARLLGEEVDDRGKKYTVSREALTHLTGELYQALQTSMIENLRHKLEQAEEVILEEIHKLGLVFYVHTRSAIEMELVDDKDADDKDADDKDADDKDADDKDADDKDADIAESDVIVRPTLLDAITRRGVYVDAKRSLSNPSHYMRLGYSPVRLKSESGKDGELFIVDKRTLTPEKKAKFATLRKEATAIRAVKSYIDSGKRSDDIQRIAREHEVGFRSARMIAKDVTLGRILRSILALFTSGLHRLWNDQVAEAQVAVRRRLNLY